MKRITFFPLAFGDFYFGGIPDNTRFPNWLRHVIRDNARSYRASISSIKEEKARLVCNLTAFDSTANNKPIFFATIYLQRRHKGIRGRPLQKVNHGEQVATQHFPPLAERKKLQKDMGVQFAIGLALYELWIKDVRDGKVSDEQSDAQSKQNTSGNGFNTNN